MTILAPLNNSEFWAMVMVVVSVRENKEKRRKIINEAYESITNARLKSYLVGVLVIDGCVLYILTIAHTGFGRSACCVLWRIALCICVCVCV